MKKKWKLICGLIFASLIAYTGVAVANSESTWYINNQAILSNHSVIVSAFRMIGKYIITLLCTFANIAENLFDKTFGLLDLTNYEAINNIIKSLKPVLAALTILCLILLGIYFIVQKEKKPVIRNILLAILAVSCSTYIFTTANTLTQSFKTSVLNSEQSSNEAYNIVNQNMIDLVGLEKSGNIQGVNYKEGRGIKFTTGITNSDKLNEIDFTEVLNWKDKERGQELYGWSDTFNNLIKYRAIVIDGRHKIVEVDKGILKTGIGNEFYYRYSFDFWACSLQILALIVLYYALSYKNVKIAYELIVGRIFAFLGAADIGGGERLKQILCFIRDTYIALIIAILSVKLYQIMTASLVSFGITGLSKGVVTLFIAIVVIDGPNLAARVLGIDAGLSSSFGRAMIAFGLAGAGIRGVTRGVTRGVGSHTKNKNTDRKVPGSENKGTSFMNNSGRKENSGNKKGSFDASFMENEKKNKKGGSSNNVNLSPSGKTSGKSSNVDLSPSGETSGKSSSLRTKESNFDAGFMETSSGISKESDNNFRRDSGALHNVDLSPSGETSGKSTSGISRKQKVYNPEFKKMIQELKPEMDASIGERKDFNRQINNIIRGNHQAIKPPEGTRAEYKFTNFEKAKQLEAAYKKGGKRKVEKENKTDG